MNHAQEFLLSVGLQNYWCDTSFNSYYRKHNGPNGNAYITGLDAADFIIREASHKVLPHERNEKTNYTAAA